MASRGNNNMVQNLLSIFRVQIEIDGQYCLLDESLATVFLSEDGDPETKRAIREALSTSHKNSTSLDTSTSSGASTSRVFETIPSCSASSESASSGHSTPSSSDSQNTMHVWKESEERFLIDLRLQREDKFSGTKSHDVLWGEIANEMKKNGIHVSKTQLINKWKALKKKYKEINDENNKTGNKKYSWKYLEQFSEVYGNKASTKVAVSFDTGRSRDKLKINTELDKDEDVSAAPEEEEDKQSTSSDTGSKSTTRAKTTKLKSTKRKISESTKLIENIQEQNRELMNSMKTQHEDKMRCIDRMLEMLEKSLDK